MASNCKVTIEDSKGRPEERFKIMLSKFRKNVSDAGVIANWKKHQFHETKGEKRRRRHKESMLQRRKENSKL